MLDLGDPYSLSVTVTDANGNLANASSVSLKITLPDGSSFDSGAIGSTSVGVYKYTYPTIQVGRHNARWEAIGTNAATFNSGFYVNPADTGEFISLEQFRTFIKKPHNKDDEVIRGFISASCAVINDRVGQVSPATFIEDVDVGRRGLARLMKYPIISVTSVKTLPGLTTVPQGDRVTGVLGWYFSAATDASLPLNVGRCGTFRVTYRAGRLDIPQNFILAALELTKHLWQSSQQNSGGGRPPVATDDSAVNGRTSFALPYNVRQLLGLDKRTRSGVFVG